MASAALTLGRTKDRRALSPLLAAERRVRDPAARAMSVYALGLLADAMPVPAAPLVAALGDRASAVRAAGVDAAQRTIASRRVGAALLARPLIGRMARDPDAVVRARAAVALAAFAPLPQPPLREAPAAGAAVAAAFARESDPTVRAHEAWALGRAFPQAPSATLVRAGLRDADPLVRMAFVDVAAKRRDRRFVPALLRLTADPSWRVAEQAREGLRRMRGLPRTAHLRAIPAGVRTPGPVPADATPALARPHGLGPPRRPTAADVEAVAPPRLTGAAALNRPGPGLHPRVRIGTTQGPIVVRLYPEWAPVTVANFVGLVDRGYYDGLRWFRIVPNFVVQTGDPHDTGDGDAGYTIPAEENPLEQRAGIISMGLDYRGDTPIRDSAGTQFYLTLSPQYHLNRAFTVFGEIESGFDVLGRLIESDRMTRVERLPPD